MTDEECLMAAKALEVNQIEKAGMCKKCSGGVVVDMTRTLTSNPPVYAGVCKKCGRLDYYLFGEICSQVAEIAMIDKDLEIRRLNEIIGLLIRYNMEKFSNGTTGIKVGFNGEHVFARNLTGKEKVSEVSDILRKRIDKIISNEYMKEYENFYSSPIRAAFKRREEMDRIFEMEQSWFNEFIRHEPSKEEKAAPEPEEKTFEDSIEEVRQKVYGRDSLKFETYPYPKGDADDEKITMQTEAQIEASRFNYIIEKYDEKLK